MLSKLFEIDLPFLPKEDENYCLEGEGRRQTGME